jgi:Cu+-exporting ATPase
MASASHDITGTLDLGVGGMTCASCVARVERAFKKVPRVQQAVVKPARFHQRATAPTGAGAFRTSEQTYARYRVAFATKQIVQNQDVTAAADLFSITLEFIGK